LLKNLNCAGCLQNRCLGHSAQKVLKLFFSLEYNLFPVQSGYKNIFSYEESIPSCISSSVISVCRL